MAKPKGPKDRKITPIVRPARDEMPLALQQLGTCPLQQGKKCPGDSCELFSVQAPEDDTKVEMRHAGVEYLGMCSIRMMAEALASMSRKHSNLADF